jgi:ATP-dependent protease ClpP protease subunit
VSKPKFKVVTNLALQTAKIYLYGIIGDFWENDNPITARVLQHLLYSVYDYQRVDIHLNGPGGDTLEAFPMANLIKSFSAKQDIHTYNDGICASAFIILLEAVKKENRHGAKGSMAMIHSASGSNWGNSESMRDTAEMLDKYDQTLAQFISDAIDLPVPEVVEKWMDGKDHWFTAEEAQAAGLYNIEDYAAAPMPENASEMKVDRVAAFYKSISNITNQTDMSLISIGNNLKKVTALGKLPVEQRTPELIAEANAELESEGIIGLSLVSDTDLQETVTAAAKVPGLEKQVTDLSADKVTLTTTVTNLQLQVKELGAKPAEEVVTPVTDAIDSTGKKPEVVTNAFETSFDREMAKLKGK